MWSILNESQKDKILKLKSSGRSYREIASALSISEGTIKSFFRRQKLKLKEVHTVCKNCGVTLEKSSRSNVKKFCSDSCRYKWWRKNAEGNRKYLKINVCKNCNTKFKSYDNKDRKYCSHECYINDRFKKQKGKFLYDKRTI